MTMAKIVNMTTVARYARQDVKMFKVTLRTAATVTLMKVTSSATYWARTTDTDSVTAWKTAQGLRHTAATTKYSRNREKNVTTVRVTVLITTHAAPNVRP